MDERRASRSSLLDVHKALANKKFRILSEPQDYSSIQTDERIIHHMAEECQKLVAEGHDIVSLQLTCHCSPDNNSMLSLLPTPSRLKMQKYGQSIATVMSRERQNPRLANGEFFLVVIPQQASSNEVFQKIQGAINIIQSCKNCELATASLACGCSPGRFESYAQKARAILAGTAVASGAAQAEFIAKNVKAGEWNLDDVSMPRNLEDSAILRSGAITTLLDSPLPGKGAEGFSLGLVGYVFYPQTNAPVSDVVTALTKFGCKVIEPTDRSAS